MGRLGKRSAAAAGRSVAAPAKPRASAGRCRRGRVMLVFLPDRGSLPGGAGPRQTAPCRRGLTRTARPGASCRRRGRVPSPARGNVSGRSIAMAEGRRRSDMTLIAFMQAQNCSNYPGSWRHPQAVPDFLTAEHYMRIARTLEEGRFHLAFFDDRLAMPDIYGDDHRPAVQWGIRSVKMDVIPLMTAMGLATTRLGIGGTCTTTYFEPFDVARTFMTLDHMIGGRAAWNVVTSLNDSEARNMGRTEHPAHDERYDRADE